MSCFLELTLTFFVRSVFKDQSHSLQKRPYYLITSY
ncbi:hypothetical protein ACUXCE_005585 [Cytobacillus horneckiae]